MAVCVEKRPSISTIEGIGVYLIVSGSHVPGSGVVGAGK